MMVRENYLARRREVYSMISIVSYQWGDPTKKERIPTLVSTHTPIASRTMSNYTTPPLVTKRAGITLSLKRLRNPQIERAIEATDNV